MNPDFGPKPALEWLPIGQVTVDARYQRDTGSRRSQNLIEKIRTGFRWSRFGVVLTVKQGAAWHVIDGQHRVEACRALGIPKIPAVVLPHATVEEAAADFVAINRDRVAVTPLHIHHAQLAAGDPEAKAIAKACKAANVEVCRYPVPAANMKPGQTLAIGTIARIVKAHGPEFATKVLASIRGARGGGEPGAINALAIRSAAEELGAVVDRVGKTAKPDERKKRACLRCQRPFISTHAGHRMCERCKGASE